MEAAGKVVVNPARAIEAAVDKYLASAKLAAAGLRTPRTIVCQTVDEAMNAFADLGGDVVLKPLFGAEGRGITRLNDEALAQRAFSLLVQLGAVLYLQEFIAHDGYDVRVLLVGEKLWAMRRRNALDWRTNVSRGATAEPMELDDETVEMARRAVAAIGAPVAGVDLLPGRDGALYAIEVNAVPGWQALSRVLQVDVARHVLEFVRTQVDQQTAASKTPVMTEIAAARRTAAERVNIARRLTETAERMPDALAVVVPRGRSGGQAAIRHADFSTARG